MIAPRPDPIVLVADDDRDTRELYRACFDTNGYRTAEAGTGSQAIVAAVEIVPDVLLTDYVLPDIDGVTIARRLRKDPRTAGIPIVIISSRTADKHRNQAAQLGVNAFLGKPYQEAELLQHIVTFVGAATPSTTQDLRLH